jgi:chorismate dehydratase
MFTPLNDRRTLTHVPAPETNSRMTPRISASSYSNTAPLIWSFLYGSNHGKVELVLDNAPARSAELLTHDRVDAALVPVIASQFIEGVKLIPGVCVGAREKVRSVCLVTKGDELENVKSVSLDLSSRTSVVLTKIIFREFLGFEPEWRDAEPNIETMLGESDAALLIGDPALVLSDLPAVAGGSTHQVSDLAGLWHKYTGLGFVFAMWMTRRDKFDIDLAAAREEGLKHLDEIASNYAPELQTTKNEMLRYLSENISYSIDEKMGRGMELYFELAAKHKLIPARKPLDFIQPSY